MQLCSLEEQLRICQRAALEGRLHRRRCATAVAVGAAAQGGAQHAAAGGRHSAVQLELLPLHNNRQVCGAAQLLGRVWQVR